MSNTNKKETTTEDLATMVQKGFNDLETKMDKGFDQVDKRFNNLKTEMDERFKKVDERFDHVDARLDIIEKDTRNLVHRQEFDDLMGRVGYLEKKFGIVSGK